MIWYPFIPYNPKYPKLFQKEKTRIQSVLPKAAIEHIGSTAILGLAGKGYIDIYVAIPKSQLSKTSKILQNKLDYTFKNNAGIPNQRLFHEKAIGKQVYYLHLVSKNNKNFLDGLNFRDYLIKSPQEVKNYSRIKRLASKKANRAKTKEEARKVYKEVKEAFIFNLTKRAIKNTG